MSTLSLGEKLRQGRIEKGLPVAELEVRTRISAKFLEALESDRRDLVPAGFFFRNWAVQYASALSLDRAEIEADVDRILSREAPLPLPGQGAYCLQGRPRLHSVHRTQRAPRLSASLAILLLVVLGCSGFYSWWNEKNTHGSMLTEMLTSFQPPLSVAEVRPAYPIQTARAPLTGLAASDTDSQKEQTNSVKKTKPPGLARVVKAKSSHPKRVRAKRTRRARGHSHKRETQA